MALTTTAHDEGIAIPDESWIEGGSEKQAYASPWYVTTLKHETLDRQQGTIAEPVVERVVAALHEYTPRQR